MADISVTLGLDDKDYTTKLNAAGKAADAFGAKAKTAMDTASHGAEGLASSAESLNKKLESMSTILVGIGFAEFIKGAIEAGSATAELAKAMGVATSTLYEMQLAAVPAGISTEKLGAMMSKMEINAQAAVEGNMALRDSFQKLGVSTDFMRTHSADEVFNKLAKSLAGITSPAERAALAMQVLGKGAKFADWLEYDQNLQKVVGTQGKAGEVMDKSKEIMDQLAVKAMLVKSEFLMLIEPLISLIGERGFGGAKIAAEALLAVMGGFVASKILSGISGIITMFKSLATTFGLTSGAAVGVTLTTEASAFAFKDAALSAAFLTGSMERVGRATAAVASAEIILTRMQIAGVVEGTVLTQATNALTLARERLAVATEAAAITQAELTGSSILGAEATVVSTGATTAATGALGGLRAAMTAMLAPLAAISAPVWIAIGAAILAGIVIWKAFSEEIKNGLGAAFVWVKAVAMDVFTWVNDGLDKMANGLRKILGLSPNAKPIEPNAADKRLEAGSATSPGSPPLVGPGHNLDPHLAIVQGLQNQADALALVNSRTLERLKLELDLVTASDAVRKSKLADFDTTTATMKEEQRIRGEIIRLQIEDYNSVVKTHGDEINFLQKQLGAYKQQAAAVAERTKLLVEAQNKEAMALFFSEEKLKVLKNVQDLTESIAQLTMSADDKKLADINKQINAEMELATKKREAQLGGPVGGDEQAAMLAKITANYQPLIDKQKELNAATKEYNNLLFTIELSNKVVEDKIRLTSQLDQLTMTNNEKIIRQLQEQIDLQIQSEIVKREANLKAGEHLGADEIAKISQQIRDANKVQLDGAQQSIDQSRTWSTGWTSAFKQYVEDSTNMASQAKQTFDSMTNNMNSAIDTFVNTGKFSFEDLATSILKDMVKIEMKALAMQAMKGMFGDSGSGGGLLSAAGSFLSGLFMAGGGDPPVGKATVVGERGPELFVPKQAGTIVPNGSLGGSQSVTNITNNHYNVNAVDAKSVAQLFAENRKQLLGTMRMAQAEQPYAPRL